MAHVLITGISSGIGYDAAVNLDKAGYSIIGTVRKDSDRENLKGVLSEKAHIIICDITNKDQVGKLTESVKAIIGNSGLFCLINNAGIAIPGPMHLVEEEQFEKQIDVNLISTRNLTNKMIPFLKESKEDLKPRIIFISSISGIFAAPFNGPYCVSKHALECLVDIYRRELYYLGIEVVSIQPGPIKTQIWSKSKGQFEKFRGAEFDDIIDKADKLIASSEKNALDVEMITQTIAKILVSRKPSLRYLVHKGGTIFKWVAKYTPSKWMDKLIRKNLEKGDPEKYRPV